MMITIVLIILGFGAMVVVAKTDELHCRNSKMINEMNQLITKEKK